MEAGITEMIFITGRTKRAIEDHFDKAYELEVELETRGKNQLLGELRSMLPRGINCIYMRQSEALGLGHAVLCARSIVGDEPFAVLLADDFIDGKPGAMKQMLDRYYEQGSSILGVEDVSPTETASYGIVDAADMAPGLLQVNGIVEKPQPEDAPSNLAVVGRYLFTPRIFDHLENVQPGKGGEIQLTDGIASLMTEERVLAYRFEGKRYDCGSKLGYMKANVELALKHPSIGSEFRDYLTQLKV